MTYDDALRDLYQTPHDRFVAERKRLSDELRAAGDRVSSTKLAKLGRPTISAWAVNQLYWHARREFDEMLAAAERLREGDLAATNAHRDAIATLRQRAANMLTDAGNAATEATLRRVTTNLSAIAAIGSFDPDPPGALAGDRAAPGFDVVLGEPTMSTKPQPERRVQERERLRAERERIAAALRTARGDLEAGQRRVQKLEEEVRHQEEHVAKMRAVVEDLERGLAGILEPD